MLPMLAEVDATIITIVLAAIVTIAGSGGLVFGALRYNRQESGAIVTQQTTILDNMRGLNDELQEALQRTRDERDQTRVERDHLRTEVQLLRNELRGLTALCEEMKAKLDES